MGLFRWLRQPTPAARRSSYRPRLEELERRSLLSLDATGQEQYLLELTNRLRRDPAGELQRLLEADDPHVSQALEFFQVDRQLLQEQWSTLAPAAPLAFHDVLMQTARDHNELMLLHDEQAHQLPGEAWVTDRVMAAGYDGTYVGENVYAFALDAYYAHAGFAIDWGFGPGGLQDPPWHRLNLINPNFRDIGISVLAVPANHDGSTGPLLITQDFGHRTPVGPAQLLGVVYHDLDRDGFYSVGEGLGGVSVTISGPAGTFTTTTRSAGGYQLALPPDAYQVTFSGGDLASPRTSTVTIGTDNVQIDLQAGPVPVVEFSRGKGGRREGIGTMGLGVRLSQATDDAVTVSYVVSGGTATAGADHHLADGTLVFAPGQTRRRIRFAVIEDRLDEPAETIEVTLVSPTGAVLGSRTVHLRTIRDNDAPPRLILAKPVEASPGAFEIVVMLSRPSGKTVQVDCVVRGGGINTVATLAFIPGQTEQRLVLTPHVSEPVLVRLANPVRASLQDSIWSVFGDA
jgi:hypothetical protein